MNYFTNLHEVTEIKRAYLKMVHEHHPDKGGSSEVMAEITNQYQEALAAANGQKYTGTDDKERTYYYNAAKEQEIIDKLAEIMGLGIDVDVMLVGKWIWITGDTKQYRKELKSVKCRWHGKRSAWYWHGKQYKSKYNARVSLNDIANHYGYETVERVQPAMIGA